jgi:hypothetical protein
MLRVKEPTNNSSWPNMPVEALECGLYYCIETFNSTVTNGTLKEVLTQVNAQRDPGSWQFLYSIANGDNMTNTEQIVTNLTFLGDIFPNLTFSATSIEFDNKTSWVNRTDLSLSNGFNMSKAAVDSISQFFETTFASTLGYTNFTLPYNGMYSIEDSGRFYDPNVIQPLYNSPDINRTFAAIARSMSNTLRDGDDNGKLQTGMVGLQITHYQIVWPWIALHGFVASAGISFLVFTVWQTWRTGAPEWKSSALAVMGVGETWGITLEGTETVKDIWKAAAAKYIRLGVQTPEV